MKIIEVKDKTLGKSIGLKPGDRLLRINGKRVVDEIDYRFRITNEEILLDVEIDGIMQQFNIEKDYDDDLGVVFEEFKIRKCANDCIFCFVDQNPKGMRSGMYFRDGDYRLSYLHGHYITLTNMAQNELDRIVSQKLSPLYISVHTTDIELRKKILLYGKNDYLLEKLDFLSKNNIELHAQVVLMPGLNDGKYLDKTIQDLYSFHPGLRSLSIVPVGLTKYRENLPSLKLVDSKYAARMVDELDSLNVNYPTSFKHKFIFLSDEFYILANRLFPDISEYDDLDLIENGIGQVQSFLDNFNKEKELLPKSFNSPKSFSIATGTLAYDIINNHIVSYLNKIENLTVKLFRINNNFYGDSVSVAGLLSAKDIISQLRDKNLGDALWCSHRILNDEGTLTLDDWTLEQMSRELGVPVNISNDSILEIFNRNIHGK